MKRFLSLFIFSILILAKISQNKFISILLPSLCPSAHFPKYTSEQHPISDKINGENIPYFI
jgi:hypothetical protein